MKNMFVCSNCDAQYAKWQGRCNECGQWSSITEMQVTKAISAKSGSAGKIPELDKDAIIDIKSVKFSDNYRFSSGLTEVDNVLGGGFVQGSLILLGGQPGVGKSTLLLQIIQQQLNNKKSVMYVAGEESPEQIKHRAERLGLNLDKMQCITATNLDLILGTLIKNKPVMVIIDSIQTVWTTEAEGSAGGVSQVRASTTKLLDVAKTYNITIIIVGHVTKDGAVAGPKTLEHLVDVVTYLEGDRLDQTRILRSVKNRFGASGEVGVLQMTKTGLQPVSEGSLIFLRSEQPMAGTVVSAFVDGSQVFFTDVQVLLEKSVGAYPRRVTTGYDVNRLQILLAIMHKHLGVNLSAYDIYLQLPGSIKKGQPSLDLAICMALLSAYSDKVMSAATIVVGEVGLNGLVRSVNGLVKIIHEAAKVKFKNIIIPKAEKNITSKNIKLVTIEFIQDIKTLV